MAIVNNAATGIGVWMSESLLSMLLYIHTEVELFPFETPLANLTFKNINRHDRDGSRPTVVCSHLRWLAAHSAPVLETVDETTSLPGSCPWVGPYSFPKSLLIP